MKKHLEQTELKTNDSNAKASTLRRASKILIRKKDNFLVILFRV